MYGFRVWLILAVRMSDPSDPQAHTLLYPQSNMAMESLTFIDNFPIATSFYRDFPASHVWLSGGDVHCKNYTYHCVVASGWHQKDPWSKPFCRPKTASEVATSLFLWRVSPRGEIEKNDLVAASHLDRFFTNPWPFISDMCSLIGFDPYTYVSLYAVYTIWLFNILRPALSAPTNLVKNAMFWAFSDMCVQVCKQYVLLPFPATK